MNKAGLVRLNWFDYTRFKLALSLFRSHYISVVMVFPENFPWWISDRICFTVFFLLFCSAKVAQKIGLPKIFSFSYKDYLDKDGKPVFRMPAPHTEVSDSLEINICNMNKTHLQ